MNLPATNSFAGARNVPCTPEELSSDLQKYLYHVLGQVAKGNILVTQVQIAVRERESECTFYETCDDGTKLRHYFKVAPVKS